MIKCALHVFKKTITTDTALHVVKKTITIFYYSVQQELLLIIFSRTAPEWNALQSQRAFITSELQNLTKLSLPGNEVRFVGKVSGYHKASVVFRWCNTP